MRNDSFIFQSRGMVKMLHNLVSSVIGFAVVRLIEHEQCNICHTHESMAKGIG